MKTRFLVIAVIGAVLMAAQTGCDTTDQGIPGTQIQANLKQLKVGLTTDQVVALIGKPAAINKRVTSTGASEVWVYYDSQFRTAGQSFAVGAAEGTGLVVKNNPMTLTFIDGKITAIETNQ